MASNLTRTENAPSPRGEHLLRAEKLSKYYPYSDKNSFFGTVKYKPAIEGVSLSLHRNETLGVVGESGSGKSTLGKVLLRLTSLTYGRIYFEGTEISRLTRGQLLPFRRKMQMIFQDSYSAFDPKMTARQILTEPFEIHEPSQTKTQREDELTWLMSKVKFKADHLSRYPHQFSASERQRLGIARALALRPKFIVCDEPLSSLDVSIQAEVLNLLFSLQEELHLSYLFISHDLRVIKHLCHRVLVMFSGHVVEEANVFVLYSRPRHPYTKSLLDMSEKIGHFGISKRKGKEKTDAPKAVQEDDQTGWNRALDDRDPHPLKHGKAANDRLTLFGKGSCTYFSFCPKRKLGVCDQNIPPLVEIADVKEDAFDGAFEGEKDELGAPRTGTSNPRDDVHKVACFFPL